MQTEKPQPRFRHYSLTRGLGFLGLHRRPMIGYFSYLFLLIFIRVLSVIYLKRYVTAKVFVTARKHRL